MLFEYDRFRVAIAQEAERREQEIADRKQQQKWFWLFDLVFDCLTLKVIRRLFSREARRTKKNSDTRAGLFAVLDHLEGQAGQQLVLRKSKWDVGWILNMAIPVPEDACLPQWIRPGSIEFLEASCPQCGEAYQADTFETGMWSDDGGPLAMSGGRKLICPEGHIVLEVLDYES